MALIDNLNPAFDATALLSSLSQVTSYCDKNAATSDKNAAVVAAKAANDASSSLTNLGKTNVTSGFNSIFGQNPSAASKLFDNVIAVNAGNAINTLVTTSILGAKSTVASGNTQLSNAFNQKVNVIQTLQDSFNVAQHSLALVMSANGQQLLFFTVQALAQKIIALEKTRDQYLQQITTYINLLYNQLKLVVNGQDLATPYINQLISALSIIETQESILLSVRNRLANQNLFSSVTYGNIVTQLQAALKLMQPPATKTGPGFFTGLATTILPGNIKNTSVGSAITSGAASLDSIINTTAEEQRFQALITMPLTLQSLGTAVYQYQLQTTEINTAIAAYLATASQYQSLKTNSTFNASMVQHMDSDLNSLAVLANDMDTTLNGTPALGNQKTPFRNSTATLKGGQWSLQLTAIIAHLQTLPSATIQDLSNSQALYNAYVTSINTLRSYNNRTLGTSTMTATQGQESAAELTTACIKIIGTCYRSITTLNVDPTTDQAFAYIRNRVQLSENLESDIIATLTPVANMQNAVTTAASGLASNLQGLFRGLGFDKAADQLGLGQFQSVITQGAAAASYVGGAILAANSLISGLQTCPAVGQKDINQIQNVRKSLQNAQLQKDINARRNAANNATARQAQLAAQKAAIQAQCTSASAVTNKCVPTAQKPVDTVSSISQVTNGVVQVPSV